MVYFSGRNKPQSFPFNKDFVITPVSPEHDVIMDNCFSKAIDNIQCSSNYCTTEVEFSKAIKDIVQCSSNYCIDL